MPPTGPLEIRRDPAADGPTQMAADAALMGEVSPDRPAIWRFYAWDPPAVSLGRFQSSAEVPASLPWVTRATGGGAIFHHAGSLTFALALCRQTHAWAADPLRLYARVNRLWIDALSRLGAAVRERREAPCAHDPDAPFLCFDRAERTDLVHGDGQATRKLLGSAQRRGQSAILIHGTLMLTDGALATRAASLASLVGEPVRVEAVVLAVADAARAAGWSV